MDPHELVPLESGVLRARPSRQISLGSRSCYKGPIRLCRMTALVIVLPCLFIFVPLYMRYRVFSGQIYPMSMTDMRLIDSKISPTWCQKQVVRSNTTFNAFVVPGPPELMEELLPVSMTRELELKDDMKEYWGFYLLKGSAVTVSACVSYPGASLIMIKGYKHLQECAYIGDDSSEELDELLEAHKLGLISDNILDEKIQQLKKIDGKANQPGTMKRHKAGVSFHDPSQSANVTSSDAVPAADVTDHDPKELQAILERLHALREAAKTEKFKHYRPPSHLMSLPLLHRHRDTNVDRDERRWLSFKDIDGNTTETTTEDTNLETQQADKINSTDGIAIDRKEKVEKTDNKINKMNKTKTSIRHQDVYNNKLDPYKGIKSPKTHSKDDIPEHIITKNGTNNHNMNINATNNVNKYVDNTNESLRTDKRIMDQERNERNNEGTNATENVTQREEKESTNSKEVFEEVLQRLKSLGSRGRRVLERLHKSLGLEPSEAPSADVAPAVSGSDEELDRLRSILVEAIDEERSRARRQQKRRDSVKDARSKRELMLGQLELQRQLNEDDEARDYAAEEGLEPDGFAEHHVQLNETTDVDMSNSEFWSSFSSSEEALLECAGLILNLPLTPHPDCRADAAAHATDAAARANALTYRVPANGYYFFVFNSENEVQTNFIRARFDLQKSRYDVARTALRECTNSTARCDLPLDIFSAQKVVLELPLRNNSSLWNEQFLVTSECEPRTSVYLLCVVAVPLLILMFAFQ